MNNRNPYSVTAAKRATFQETDYEHRCRKDQGFPEFEDMLPKLPSRFDSSLIDGLTSYLGSKNPLSRPVDPKNHTVWLLDNTAFPSRSSSSGFQAEFIAAYFIKNSGRDVSVIVADIAEKLGLGKGDAAEALIAERVQPFLDAVLPARTVEITFQGDASIKKLGM